tara:strand:+ start:33811 stop:34386 length:576 start_codon:yes stop_codon:yes gene_type:complete
MKKLLLSTALVAGFAAPAFAETTTYTVDPSHTNILMSVSHLGFSTMVLEALKPEGTVKFDQENPQNSAVNITLKAAHIDGDDQKFNAHLQSADFFNATEYPEITFKSKEVKVTGEGKGQVLGDFTLLGITKPVTLEVTFNKAGLNPFSNTETVGFTASTNLKRTDYGMDYGVPAIGDDIKVDINLEAIKAE